MSMKSFNIALLVLSTLAFIAIVVLNNEHLWLNGFNELNSTIKSPYWFSIVGLVIVALLIYVCYRTRFKTRTVLVSIIVFLVTILVINHQITISLSTNDVQSGISPFFKQSISLNDIETVTFNRYSLEFQTTSGKVKTSYYPLLGKQKLISEFKKLGHCVSHSHSADNCPSIKIEHP